MNTMSAGMLALWAAGSFQCREALGEAPPQRPILSRIQVAADQAGFLTSSGEPFSPLGVNYYRPGTGWAPQVWKQFDAEATREDFRRMKKLGVNCVRVFLTYGSFYTKPGELRSDGLEKFDRFLDIAEEFGIYVHPTGPDHWEGMPEWRPVSIEDEPTLAALESFWKLFAARYRSRAVIFAYDLKNEPEVPWKSPAMQSKWNGWAMRKYGTKQALATAWRLEAALASTDLPIPGETNQLKSVHLLDYQAFREELADEWTRRQVEAIKSVDPKALVTVGLIQWSVPCVLPGSVRYYAAFRPQRQARFLDFMEVHFYPLAKGAYEYGGEAEEQANLAYAEAVVREVAACGKPLVLAEFGWYGGGKPKFDSGRHPAADEAAHARYCRRVVEVTSAFATGWLNWGFYDQPEATDCSEFTGLLTSDGRTKAWGRTFADLVGGFKTRPPPYRRDSPRPQLDWDACITSTEAGAAFQKEYLKAFSAGAGP